MTTPTTVTRVKLTRKRTIVDVTYIDVPDHYFYDGSIRGKVVDILLQDEPKKEHRENFREELLDEDADIVERAVHTLQIAYARANDIILIIRGRSHDI